MFNSIFILVLLLLIVTFFSICMVFLPGCCSLDTLGHFNKTLQGYLTRIQLSRVQFLGLTIVVCSSSSFIWANRTCVDLPDLIHSQCGTN